MILSFSVPEKNKYIAIINWYENADRQERSREFREILLSYLMKPHHTMDSQATNHVSLQPLQKIKISTNEEIDIDFDAKLDFIGMRG